MLSLVQMPRSIIAVEMVKDAGLPYIVLLTDPTTGGVSASFAMVGDVHIAEPGATIGFAGRRVIEETVRETLPDDFQTAEYLLEHGIVDMVVPRAEQNSAIGSLLGLLMDPHGKNRTGKTKKKGKDGSKDKEASKKSAATPSNNATAAIAKVKAARDAAKAATKNAVSAPKASEKAAGKDADQATDAAPAKPAKKAASA